MIRKRLYYYVVLTVTVLLTTGCHKKSVIEQVDTNSPYYRVHDTVLPNPNYYFDENLTIVNEIKSILQADVVYRLVNISKEDSFEYALQICEAPYDIWDTYSIDYLTTLFDGTDPYVGYGIIDMQVTTEQNVYFILEKIHFDIDTETIDQTTCCITKWNKDNQESFVCDIPESFSAYDKNFGLVKEINIYDNEIILYDRYSRIQTQLDTSFQEIKRLDIDGGIYNTFTDPKEDNIYGYGLKDNKLGVWDIKTNAMVLDITEQYNKYDLPFIHLTGTDSNQIFLCDETVLCRVDDGKLQEVSKMLDQGFIIDQIYDMSSKENCVTILAMVEGDYCLLQASEEERPTYKEELVIAGLINTNTQRAITMFNRRNDAFHINIYTMKEEESYSDFMKRLQIDVSSGNAPDIYTFSMYEAEDYIKNGFLSPMNDFIKEEEHLWKAALEAVQYNDIQYCFL